MPTGSVEVGRGARSSRKAGDASLPIVETFDMEAQGRGQAVVYSLALAPSEAYESFPAIKLLVSRPDEPRIEEQVLACTRKSTVSLLCHQYCLDHPGFVQAVVSRLRHSNEEGSMMDVRFILDHNQMQGPSSVNQHLRVRDLIEWGAAIRTWKPGAASFSSQHSKAWLFDSAVYIVGSANCTVNSFSNNLEQAVLFRDATSVAEARELFEKNWALATPLTNERFSSIQAHWAEAKGRRRGNSRERVQSPDRARSQDSARVAQYKSLTLDVARVTRGRKASSSSSPG